MKNLLSRIFAAKKLDVTCSKCGTLNTVKLDDSNDEEYETDESTTETGDNDPDNDGDDDTESEFDDSMKNTPKPTTAESLAKSLLASARASKTAQIKSDRAGKPTDATRLARKLNLPADNTALTTLAKAIKRARGV
jgi:hypothetical protein